MVTSALQREVNARFGLLPNFFASAPDAPEIVEKLWDFAKSSYLDNPMPSLLKERLFVYLSRFCEIRYCIARHCAFLLGRGHASGDPSVSVQSIGQAIHLLKTPPPWARDTAMFLEGLETLPLPQDWPAVESKEEDWLIAAATLVFVEPARSNARNALRKALGGKSFEHLLGLLAFIRTAHYWTVLHPNFALEEDVKELLSVNEELARLLLEDPESGRCDISARLFAELVELRELNERRELEKAKRALEIELQQKEALLKEVNHRVKNSLQIVSSILQLEVSYSSTKESADAMRNAAARVLAVAAVHERLYTGPQVGCVQLDSFLPDLTRQIGQACDCREFISIDIDKVEVPTDLAISLALVLNELLTNAIKHAQAPYGVRLWRDMGGKLTLTVRDGGQGPKPYEGTAGFGTRIVKAMAKQLRAVLEPQRDASGYTIALILSLPAGNE